MFKGFGANHVVPHLDDLDRLARYCVCVRSPASFAWLIRYWTGTYSADCTDGERWW